MGGAGPREALRLHELLEGHVAKRRFIEGGVGLLTKVAKDTVSCHENVSIPTVDQVANVVGIPSAYLPSALSLTAL